MTLADRYEIDPELLEYPCEDLKVAVVMAELNRLRDVIRAYEDEDETWVTKTAEWSAVLDEYDGVLEVACDILCLPLKRLPYGCRRHFRPQDRAKIEKLIWDRVTSGSHAASESRGLSERYPLTDDEANPAVSPES